jgi:hypothetical protein
MNKYGIIQSIDEITELETRPVGFKNEKTNLGMTQMLNFLCGHSSMDGYVVTTSNTKIMVLIDNGQSCCESWGYFSSDDDLSSFIGADLKEVNLTDVACKKEAVEKSDYYEDEGGIQFVDFVTNRGVFQLAVYNAHNGYYGHGIAVVIGDEVIHEDTL